MQRNPADIFDEMDELFDHLFARMNRQFGFADPFSGFSRTGVPGRWQEPEVMTAAPDGAERGPETRGAPEVQRVGDEVRVIAALPGIEEEALRLIFRKGTLIIDAGDAEHHVRHAVPLPPVEPAPVWQTFRNGVLEVSFQAVP